MNNKKQQTERGSEPACPTATIPNWKIERYLLGELPEQDMDEIRALEETDSRLRGQIDELRASNVELIGIYPPEFMTAGLSFPEQIAPAAANSGIGGRKRLGSHKTHTPFSRRYRNVPNWAVPVFTCAAALLIVPVLLFSSGMVSTELASSNPVGDTRVKGIESRLEVWRKAGAYAERLDPGAAAAQGDLIQLRYLVPEDRYGAIVSIDGRGLLTVHLSGEGGRAAKLTPGRPVTLDHSYELDDAERFEIFYLITAPQNFDVNAAARSIRKINDPDSTPVLSRNQSVTVFALRKI